MAVDLVGEALMVKVVQQERGKCKDMEYKYRSSLQLPKWATLTVMIIVGVLTIARSHKRSHPTRTLMAMDVTAHWESSCLRDKSTSGNSTTYCLCMAEEVKNKSGVLYRKLDSSDTTRIDAMISSWLNSESGQVSIKLCRAKSG